jgi:hypothetical protein
LDTIESTDAVAFMVDDVASFVEAAPFAIMNRIELFLSKILEDGTDFYGTVIAKRNL